MAAASVNLAVLSLRRTMCTKSANKWAEVTRTITRTDLDDFGRLTGDTNPIHLEGERPLVHGAFLLGLVREAFQYVGSPHSFCHETSWPNFGKRKPQYTSENWFNL